MTTGLGSFGSGGTELFLSRTYDRIRRTTMALGVAGAIAEALMSGWRGSMGLVVGAVVGYLNLVWLHKGSEMIIERLLAPDGQTPSRFRLAMAFTARYVLVLAIAYVIIKSIPYMLLGFTIGLFLPILAAMCEGVYEVFVDRRQN